MNLNKTQDQPTFDPKSLLAKAIAALPDRTSLIYIDRNDELNDEQCQLIVAGQKDQVLDEMDFIQGQDGSIDSYLEDALPDEDERQVLRDSDDDFHEFEQACYDRDDSTPAEDLLSNTGKKLVKFYIRNAKGERIALPFDSWRWDDVRIEREARRLCDACKLDWDQNRKQFIELVENATYGGVLLVMVYIDMSDVAKWVEHCIKGDERGRVRLTFTNPHVVVHDFLNGSGHDTRVNGQIVVRFGRGALDDRRGAMQIDAKGIHGYSWDDTCGLYRPAYATDVKAHLYQAKKGQKPDAPSPESYPGM